MKKAKATRQQILQIALECFLQKSFKAVTMNELVQKSGLSKGAFYHYFDSKEALFMEAVQTAFSHLSVDYAQLDQHSLGAFYRGYLQHMNTVLAAQSSLTAAVNPNFYYLIFDALKHFPEMRLHLQNFEDEERSVWARVLAHARQQGEIVSSLSDDQLAQLFIYSGDGIGLRAVYQGNLSQSPGQIQALWDALYADLQPGARR